nr:hypothetical protein [Klebsiella pneumoniae]
MGEISVKTGNNARNGGKNSLNRLIRCVCGKKIGPDPRNFNQRVSLGRNDLLIRTFPKDDYDKLLVLKAYILKRLDRIDDALSITDELLMSNEDNPILIYNKACYQYILRRCQADNSDIKDMIRRALTIKVTDPEFIRRQEKIRTKVIGNKDNDLEGLFTDAELEELKVAIK